MKVAQNGISDIKATPTAGDPLSSLGGLGDLYADTADEFYTNQFPIFCISPPVLNCDDGVFYPYPQGSEKMLGRQTSGFWAGEDDTTPGKFYIGNFTFDSKLGIDDITYYDRLYLYEIADGDDFTVSGVIRQDLDVDDLAGTKYAYYHRPRRLIRGGDSFSANLGEAPYRFQDPAVEKYEQFYGSDNPANYGPFNMSTSDLVSVASLSNQEFRQVSYTPDDNRGELHKGWFRDVFQGTPTQETPWSLESTLQDVNNSDKRNVHVLRMHIITAGQGA